MRSRLRYTIPAVLLVAAGLSAAVYAAVVFVPRIELPGLRKHTHMAPTTATFGSRFTLSGTTPHHANGTVSVKGSWNGGAWQPLGSSTTVGGTFSVSFRIRDHGTLKLRTIYPGGVADGKVVVP